VRGTRRRARRRGLVFVSTGSQAERAGQNGRNHNRFQKFQSISPPFPAGCFVCLGKELHGSNAFLTFLDVRNLIMPESRRGFRPPQDQTVQ
jgi:hypothetical protein